MNNIVCNLLYTLFSLIDEALSHDCVLIVFTGSPQSIRLAHLDVTLRKQCEF